MSQIATPGVFGNFYEVPIHSAFFFRGWTKKKTMQKRSPLRMARWRLFRKKLQKSKPVVNRNSQSYARENIVLLNTTS